MKVYGEVTLSKTNLRKIGFWYSSYEEDKNLPHVTEFIDKNLPSELRKILIEYLSSEEKIEHYKGWSTCRICGKNNGSTDMQKDEYIYPEGLIHYVSVHNVVPSQRLLRRVIKLYKVYHPYTKVIHEYKIKHIK